MFEHAPGDGRERVDGSRRRPARVLLVDDHSVVPSGCRRLLDRDPVILVGDETAHFADVPALIARNEPRVVVAAITGGDLSPVAVVGAVRALAPSARVLVVSTRADHASLRSALQAGARGYVLRDDPDLARAVRALAEGGAYFSPDVANLMREGYLEGGAAADDALLARLTETERVVLRGLVAGLATAEIASRLQTSARAIDQHRRRILEVLAPARASAAMHREWSP